MARGHKKTLAHCIVQSLFIRNAPATRNRQSRCEFYSSGPTATVFGHTRPVADSSVRLVKVVRAVLYCTCNFG